MGIKDILRSKTIWGVALFAASRIVVDRSPMSWMENVSMLWAAIGARDAAHKIGK